MEKEWDMIDTRLNEAVSQTLCGCEEEEMYGLTFGQDSQKCSTSIWSIQISVEYTVLMLPIYLASFSNLVRYNGVILSVIP